MQQAKKPLRRIGSLLLVLVLSFSLFLTGCTSNQKPAQEAPKGTNVNYGISNAWDSLMPYYSVSGNNYSRIIYDKIYDRLAYVEPDGTCLPRAAERWESAEDGYAILFHLNQKAAFHDGTPVTAKHWVETIQLVTNPACETLGRTTFAGLVGTDDTGALIPGEKLGVEVLDDYTLKLSFQQPVIPTEFLVDKNRDIYVLPTHLLGDIAPEQMMKNELWLKPVGSGPCRFVSEISGSNLVLESNKDYQLGAPGFDTLTITVMDKANLLTALIAGDLDYYAFGGNVTEENRAVAEKAGLTVLEGTVPSTFYELMLNNETIPDARIRQAISMALDKKLLCEQSAGNMGQVVDSSILPDTPYSGAVAEESYQPEEAKALLKQAGGSEKTYRLASTAARSGLAALVQQNLEAVGIKVQIESVDSSTMFAGMYDGTYDMALASHTPNTLPLWFTGHRFSADNNLFRVADVKPYSTLISSIEQETNETARIDLVDELEQYLEEQMPFVPLWVSRSLHVQSNTVTGIDYPASAFCNENVWAWEKTAQ